jgi:membrane protease YdiL (CAAX protease family)
MATLILSIFVILIITMIIASNYYFTLTKKIMKRYDKAPYLLILFYNPSYHITFYADYKNDLNPKEINAFKYYFILYIVTIVLFIALLIIGNTLIYLNKN